ncbi:MAG: glycosyltransferase [Firmicutes bacterium]|nr:glycosyltransferase [Bacillota bacterium]
MLLTIGMIMKNEERFLRDCLTAIKPILDNVDSELIIHDTGSTDNSIAIAKEFTNNVFEIEWRNDFAWARQQGFERAKGEWFFKLDADEIFEDVQDIVDFFNSGEYKNYGTATVKRTEEPNIQNSQTIAKHLRIFKIIENMQWHNEIHEYLAPYTEPTKHLNVILLHYGNTTNVVLEKDKVEKYVSNMLNIYEKQPNNYHNILALTSFYYHVDQPTALKYAEIGITLAKTTEKLTLHEHLQVTQQSYPSFVQLLTSLYFNFEEYQKLIDLTEQYFNDTPKSQISEAAVTLKLTQCWAFEKQCKFIQAKNAALEAYKFKKMADNDKLKAIYAFVMLYPKDDIIYISSILKNFVSANLLKDALDWIDNFTEVQQIATVNYKIDKYICYANFAKYILELNPKMLHDLPKILQAKYCHNPQEYSYICNIIENVLNNSR